MRWSTVCFAMIAVIVGTVLFRIKYEVDNLETKHRVILGSIQETKEAIHVLKAEWAHLNEPSRIQRLSAKYLSNDILKLEEIKVSEEQKKSEPIQTISNKIEDPIDFVMSKQVVNTKQDNSLDVLLDEVAEKPKKLKNVSWGKR